MTVTDNEGCGPCSSVPDPRRGARYCRSCYLREGTLVEVERCHGRITREAGSDDYHMCARTYEPPERRTYHSAVFDAPAYKWGE